MNKKQRSTIQKISLSLNQLNTQLELLMEEEQSKIDNLPDSLIGSSKEDEYQEGVDALSEAIESLQNAIESLQPF